MVLAVKSDIFVSNMTESINENNARESPVSPQVSGDLGFIRDAASAIRSEIARFIIGQEQHLDFLLAALFTKGHILLEGVPGIAKTYLAKLFAKTIQSGFSRIQFTPDLMPGDILGTNVYNVKNSEFSFKKGPVFSNIVLIDEINRAPSKTQAALFEVMQEQQITMDGITYPLDLPFMVIATQNPIEQEGTYKLPEAQLDRFMFKLKMNYPTLDEESRILGRFQSDFDQSVLLNIQSVMGESNITKIRHIIEQIEITGALLQYIAQIVHNTRNHKDLFLGASTRASLGILKASKALAALNGRNFVIPEDIQMSAYPVLNHRIMLTPEREMEGLTPEDVIKDIIAQIEIPR